MNTRIQHSNSPSPAAFDRAGLRQTQRTATENPSFWQAIGSRLIQWLVNSPEPQIQFRRDRQGNHYWRVYDPISGQSHIFSTDTEVRMWLDGRYYG